MNKLIATFVAVFITLFGATAASAQGNPPVTIEGTPALCAESDTVPTSVVCPVDEDGNEVDENGNVVDEQELDGEGLYPIVVGLLPEIDITTTTVTSTTVPAVLPATGSSGVSSLLQIGALFLSGGLIVAAVSRRRSTAPAA
jgi:LPXTG-motif cell wall-anchored protein